MISSKFPPLQHGHDRPAVDNDQSGLQGDGVRRALPKLDFRQSGQARNLLGFGFDAQL
jgi:hypothetical protein